MDRKKEYRMKGGKERTKEERQQIRDKTRKIEWNDLKKK